MEDGRRRVRGRTSIAERSRCLHWRRITDVPDLDHRSRFNAPTSTKAPRSNSVVFFWNFAMLALALVRRAVCAMRRCAPAMPPPLFCGPSRMCHNKRTQLTGYDVLIFGPIPTLCNVTWSNDDPLSLLCHRNSAHFEWTLPVCSRRVISFPL